MHWFLSLDFEDLHPSNLYIKFQFLLLREIIGVYFENNSKHINTMWQHTVEEGGKREGGLFNDAGSF